MTDIIDDLQYSVAMAPEELREAAISFLGDRVDRRAAYREDSRCQEELLRAVAELGWLQLAVPEEAGGLGQKFLTHAPIYEEIGRALAPLWIADSLAAAQFIGEIGSAQAELLRAIGEGTARIALAFNQSDIMTPTEVTGRIDDVVDAANATHILLLGSEDAAGDAYLVCLDRRVATIDEVESWDRTRRLGNISLTNAPVAAIFKASVEQIQALQAHLDLAVAWDGLGGAAQALSEAVVYMQTREQFGRPIGSFQALKHRAADLKVMLDLAMAQARHATEEFSSRRGRWQASSAQARLLACEAYRSIAEENIQFHGGIGFTWEHDAHIFFKRAWLNENLRGTADQLRDRIASLIPCLSGYPGSH